MIRTAALPALARPAPNLFASGHALPDRHLPDDRCHKHDGTPSHTLPSELAHGPFADRNVRSRTRRLAAVAGLTREDLTARPDRAAWSILEVVVHIADSDAISIDRMKRMLSEDNPPLLYADETVYVQRLHTHDQDIEDALTLLEVGRRQWARVLRCSRTSPSRALASTTAAAQSPWRGTWRATSITSTTT